MNHWSLIMIMLVILGAALSIGLFLHGIWEACRDDDVMPSPRKDCVVNNWKYSGLPPR
jgi:hypothetical protein